MKPLLLASLALAASGAQAQALTLDSFDGADRAGVYWTALNPALTTLRADQAAAVPGGTRTLQITPDTQAGGSISGGLSGGGVLWSFGWSGQPLAFTLGYGLAGSMNLDLSGQQALQLDLWFNDAMKLTVYATTDAATPGDNPAGSSFTLDIAGGADQAVLLPLASFVSQGGEAGPVNWADVDSLSFAFASTEAVTPITNVSLALQGIHTLPVPEPAPAALLLAGLAAIGWRRWGARQHAH